MSTRTINEMSEKELNEAIAKEMGWTDPARYTVKGTPFFIGDWKKIGEVIEDAVDKGFCCTTSIETLNSSIPNTCQFYNRNTSRGYASTGGEDVKILICRSYLKAMEEYADKNH